MQTYWYLVDPHNKFKMIERLSRFQHKRTEDAVNNILNYYLNMNEVKNAYPEEQKKLDNEFQTKLELSLKIEDLLDQYGYDLDAVLVNGMPQLRLHKL